MRKTQVALAALALMASTAALADGVKLYGVADFSMLNDTKGTFAYGAGNNAGSIIGVTGSEDLGNGLKAAFTLEGGVSFGTGEIVNGGPGSNGGAYAGIFNRQSNISLGNDMATVTVGGQISTFVAASLTGLAGTAGNGAFVPALSRLTGGLGGAASEAAQWNGAGAASGAFFYPDLATINVNVNGVSVTAQTKIGDKTPAGVQVGKYSAYSATTSVAGINLAVAGMNMTNAAGLKGSAYTIGGNTQIAGITLRGAYGSGSSDLYDGTGSSVGFDYSLTDALAIGYTYAKGNWDVKDGAGTNGTQNSIGAKYSLSPRTFAYVTYSSFSEIGVQASQGGSGKHVSIVGVAHSF